MAMSICVIPARMGSSRFPNKPMTPILGMPMIGHVAARCKLEPIFSRVVVATCDAAIVEYCTSIGVESVFTSAKHERASDRVQEAVTALERVMGDRFASVTMVQGDEPMVTPTMLRTAVDALATSQAPVVNLMSEINSEAEYRDPNCVKVVTDIKGRALYFSREAIPSSAKVTFLPRAHKQVCIIPFTREFLDVYSALAPTYLEEVESVDMMRVLENGYIVFCAKIVEPSYPVDVPHDVLRVEEHLRKCPLLKRYLQ